jgi:hypothetical protein
MSKNRELSAATLHQQPFIGQMWIGVNLLTALGVGWTASIRQTKP